MVSGQSVVRSLTALPIGSTQTSLHSSLLRKLFLLPPSPPHQNLVQPPYSMSKLHLTTKSLLGPRSFSRPQTSGGATGRSWSSHPAKLTPDAVEFPSGQQPNSLAAQPQPSWSTPCNSQSVSGSVSGWVGKIVLPRPEFSCLDNTRTLCPYSCSPPGRGPGRCSPRQDSSRTRRCSRDSPPARVRATE